WKLTNDFNAGRRARYVHPLRLYLLGSIAFFLVLNMAHFKPSIPINMTEEDKAELDAALAKLAGPESALTPEQRAQIESARTRLAGKDESALSKEEQDAIEQGLEHKRMPGTPRGPADLKGTERAKLRAILKGMPVPPIAPPEDAAGESRPDATPPPAADLPIVPSDVIAPPPPPPDGPVPPDVGKNPNKSEIDNWVEKRIKEKLGEGGTKAELFVETLRSNIPAMMLCCIPLFAVVLKLLYLGRRRYYVEHLVYALHIHTFAYVATVVITLLELGAEHTIPAVSEPIIAILTVAAVVQVFLSIRRVYGQGWFASTFKFLLGGLIYFFVLVSALAITALITLILPGK
ncbi:MAG TPA: DUF3667 domain-containing protein, partial [Chthoniobacterales bacterium]